MADAGHLILTSDAKTLTGNFFVDDEVLTASLISVAIIRLALPISTLRPICSCLVSWISRGSVNEGRPSLLMKKRRSWRAWHRAISARVSRFLQPIPENVRLVPTRERH